MKFAKNKHKNPKRKHAPEPGTMSAKADRHALYELSVQDVSHEYDFINKTYRDIRGYNAHTLREDFCGTVLTIPEAALPGRIGYVADQVYLITVFGTTF